MPKMSQNWLPSGRGGPTNGGVAEMAGAGGGAQSPVFPFGKSEITIVGRIHAGPQHIAAFSGTVYLIAVWGLFT